MASTRGSFGGFVAVVALAAASVIGALAWGLWPAAAPEGQAVAVAPSPPPSGGPALLAGPEALLRAELQRLQQRVGRHDAELDLLRRGLVAARQVAAAPPAAAVARPPAVPATPGPAPDPAARREQAQQEGEALAAEREARFRAEAIDPQWALSMQGRVQQALLPAEGEPAPPVLQSLECRSRSCRLELAGDPAQDFLPILALRLVGDFPSIGASRVEAGDGGVTTVLYLAA